MDPGSQSGSGRESRGRRGLRDLVLALVAGGSVALAARLAVLEGLWSLERERPFVLRWLESVADHPRRSSVGFALILLGLLARGSKSDIPPERDLRPEHGRKRP